MMNDVKTTFCSALAEEQRMEGVVVGSWTLWAWPGGSANGNGPSKNCWLDTQRPIFLMEVNPGHLRCLDVGPKLGGCLNIAICSLTEPKASLETSSYPVSISIVDSASNKPSNSILTVLVQLQAPSEGGANTTGPVPNLCCYSQLRNKLSISINSAANTGSKAQVAVILENAVGCC